MKTRKFNKTKIINSANQYSVKISPLRMALTTATIFILFGALVITFPKFFTFLFGSFLFFIAGVIGLAAWKFNQFKSKLEKNFKDFQKQSSIVVQHVDLSGDAESVVFDEDVVEVEDKKITWH